MEHLLLPRGAVLADNERARYIADPYDGGSFMTYPHRSRFKQLYDTLLPSGHLPNDDAVLGQQEEHDLEVFAQTWLFFGLLHEVFGDKAPAEHFITADSNDGQALLSTAQLSRKTEEWIVRHYHLGKAGKNLLLEDLSECILESERFLKVLNGRSSFGRTLLWVLESVSETLEKVILRTLGGVTVLLPTAWDMYHTNEISNLMVSRGWCQSDMKEWRKVKNGFQRMFYLSKIEQPKIKDHSNCVGEECVANQYDAEQQPTVHRCADKKCGNVHVDNEAVKSILADGHIALLDITINETDIRHGLKIQVVSSREYSIYIALSHVWVDGLGNPSGNALPRCQLLYLATTVQRFSREAGHEKVFLWLDTLCCPVESTHHRMLCIARMPQIYAEANHVLVLEAALAEYSSDELDCVELAARFVHSSWTKRLWTLQEGVLARELWIQLKDKAVNIDTVAAELAERFSTQFVHSQLLVYLLSSISALRYAWMASAHEGVRDISMLQSAVERRSVSVASDEPLCLATLLQLDQGAVAQASEGERMKVFWEIYGAANRSLNRNIVSFTGPRLVTPGFRWAPSTLMSAVHFWGLGIAETSNETASIHRRGLKAKFPAFELLVPQLEFEADARRWTDLFNIAEPKCLVRRAENDWFSLRIVPAPAQASEISIREVLRSIQGRHVILSRSDIDQSLTTEIFQALVVSVPDNVSEEEPTVHAHEAAHLSRLPAHLSSAMEAVWQLCQDQQLQAVLRSFVKDPDEIPLRADHWLFKEIPNAVMLRLHELASQAVQDGRIALSDGSIAEEMDVLLTTIIHMACGNYGIVQRTWDGSKTWYID